jgi:hypothetical protein
MGEGTRQPARPLLPPCRMDNATSNNAGVHLGFWAAVVAAASSLSFSLSTVLILPGILGPPWDAYSSLIPSLVLAPAFLIVLVCVHSMTTADRRIWTRLAVAFATAYVPLVCTAYVVELLVVEPLLLQGETQRVALLTLASKHSIFNAIDGLGYVFMGLATLFAAPAFSGSALDLWIRRLFFANAVLIVPVVLTYFVDRRFIYAAFPWAITVPGATILLALFFRRARTWRAHPAPEAR